LSDQFQLQRSGVLKVAIYFFSSLLKKVKPSKQLTHLKEGKTERQSYEKNLGRSGVKKMKTHAVFPATET